MIDKLTHNPPIEYQVSYWRLRDFRIYGNLISANKVSSAKPLTKLDDIGFIAAGENHSIAISKY